MAEQIQPSTKTPNKGDRDQGNVIRASQAPPSPSHKLLSGTPRAYLNNRLPFPFIPTLWNVQCHPNPNSRVHPNILKPEPELPYTHAMSKTHVFRPYYHMLHLMFLPRVCLGKTTSDKVTDFTQHRRVLEPRNPSLSPVTGVTGQDGSTTSSSSSEVEER
ncbi:hypothetical protein DL95DRAFT_413128 [Leptodontidium sp. 2 PMI_412]|nr:hypothetical protein DL95DRAFT_413128 [Leptodontidium sp. 2 PMI_412]